MFNEMQFFCSFYHVCRENDDRCYLLSLIKKENDVALQP